MLVQGYIHNKEQQTIKQADVSKGYVKLLYQ